MNNKSIMDMARQLGLPVTEANIEDVSSMSQQQMEAEIRKLKNEIKKDPEKNIERILTALKKMPGQKAVAEERLEDARQQFAQAKEEVQKPFDKEDKLKYVQNRLTKINAELDMEPKTEPKLVKKEELKKCL